MKKTLVFAVLAGVVAGGGLAAAPAYAHQGHDHAAPAQVPQSADGVGVVRAIDTRNNRITIAHEPMPTLGWPAMTMAFEVHSADLLTNVAVGNRVNFTLVNHNGQPMVSALQVQR
jgi:Cu(I)/Ag(I) efflux system periplasmic protein CusF